jgi:hypothetical protein
VEVGDDIPTILTETAQVVLPGIRGATFR